MSRAVQATHLAGAHMESASRYRAEADSGSERRGEAKKVRGHGRGWIQRTLPTWHPELTRVAKLAALVEFVGRKRKTAVDGGTKEGMRLVDRRHYRGYPVDGRLFRDKSYSKWPLADVC